jgi:hypothetical protein
VLLLHDTEEGPKRPPLGIFQGLTDAHFCLLLFLRSIDKLANKPDKGDVGSVESVAHGTLLEVPNAGQVITRQGQARVPFILKVYVSARMISSKSSSLMVKKELAVSV